MDDNFKILGLDDDEEEIKELDEIEPVEEVAEDEDEIIEEELTINENMDEELKKELEKVITKAMLVRENAHHNHFKVGAVLKMKSGNLYTGCNINNQDLLSICAERVAFAKAITNGEKDFEYILVVGGPVDGFLEKCLPCGYCRQFMSEFVDKNFKIYVYYNNKIEEYSIEELLPEAFVY